MDPLLPRAVDGYLDDLVTAQLYDPVLVDLERRAEALALPTRGRAVGRHLEIVLQLAGARRVVELDAGFGETTYWLARAVGDDGEVIAVIADADDAATAESMLRRAGLFERVTILIHPPATALASIAGPLDAVVGTVDASGETAQPWIEAADRVEVGGILALLDVLCGGSVARGSQTEAAPAVDRVIAISREVVNDPRYDSTITPLRDGIHLAHRRR